MKTKKIVFSMAVALLIMAAGIPAFAAGGRQAQSGTTGPANYGARTTGPNYWLTKYAQPVTLHVVNLDKTDMHFRSGESMTDNAWTRGMKETLNVDIVTDWVSSSTEYTTKLNLAIASRQLPDVFNCNAVQFQQLLEAGMLADITDYIENNTSDYLKAIMAYAPDVTETAKQNGRLYAMPIFGGGPLPVPTPLWLRRDWMQAANAQAPKTIAEMETLMQTFMRLHPGTYGTPLNKGLDELYWLAPAFKAYPSIWVTGSNGQIVHGAVQPEMRDVLQVFNDWYKKGYLRQDFMAMDSNAVRQDVISGKFGIEVFYQWWFINLPDLVNSYGPEAIFEAYEIPSRDGSPVLHPTNFDNGGYLVINKDCKNIDAAIKCMSYYQYIVNDAASQGIMNPEQILSFLYSEGQHIMPMFIIHDPMDEERQYRQIQEAKRTGDASKFTSSLTLNKYLGAKAYVDSGDMDGIMPWMQQYADRSAYTANIKILEEQRYMNSRMTGPAPEELAAFGSTLDDLLKEGFTKIIIGEQPLSYFDTLVREWRSAGGDTVTAAVNRLYNK
jgi:putative aldouronate transport system substrate-binding protein